MAAALGDGRTRDAVELLESGGLAAEARLDAGLHDDGGPSPFGQWQ
jgi:hypothetical protein